MYVAQITNAKAVQLCFDDLQALAMQTLSERNHVDGRAFHGSIPGECHGEHVGEADERRDQEQ